MQQKTIYYFLLFISIYFPCQTLPPIQRVVNSTEKTDFKNNTESGTNLSEKIIAFHVMQNNANKPNDSNSTESVSTPTSTSTSTSTSTRTSTWIKTTITTKTTTRTSTTDTQPITVETTPVTVTRTTSAGIKSIATKTRSTAKFSETSAPGQTGDVDTWIYVLIISSAIVVVVAMVLCAIICAVRMNRRDAKEEKQKEHHEKLKSEKTSSSVSTSVGQMSQKSGTKRKRHKIVKRPELNTEHAKDDANEPKSSKSLKSTKSLKSRKSLKFTKSLVSKQSSNLDLEPSSVSKNELLQSTTGAASSGKSAKTKKSSKREDAPKTAFPGEVTPKWSSANRVAIVSKRSEIDTDSSNTSERLSYREKLLAQSAKDKKN